MPCKSGTSLLVPLQPNNDKKIFNIKYLYEGSGVACLGQPILHCMNGKIGKTNKTFFCVTTLH